MNFSSISFHTQFKQLGRWRQSYAAELAQFRAWLHEQELDGNAAVQDHLQRLDEQLRGDKVQVAFVADASRGKSELINAVFFRVTSGASCRRFRAAEPCAQSS